MAASALVVEDNEDLQMMYLRMLERYGYKATGTSEPADALWRLGDEGFDLVLRDLDLGGEMDGIELCRRMRAIAQPTLRVLFLTGSNARTAVLSAFPAGADDYLIKPPPMDALRKACTELMAISSAEELLERRQRYLAMLEARLQRR